LVRIEEYIVTARTGVAGLVIVVLETIATSQPKALVVVVLETIATFQPKALVVVVLEAARTSYRGGYVDQRRLRGIIYLCFAGFASNRRRSKSLAVRI
jgi:hypothetical protein